MNTLALEKLVKRDIERHVVELQFMLIILNTIQAERLQQTF